MKTEPIINYYELKLKQHGASARGVDWNSTESQHLRFQQLMRLLPNTEEEKESTADILDYGCGYGELYKYLRSTDTARRASYYGYDLSAGMIEQAQTLFPEHRQLFFNILPARIFDWVFASGVFNVKIESSTSDWEDYIYSQIHVLSALARKGFAFNLLSTYSDIEKRASHLFYADPMRVFDFCKKNISPYVCIFHDYPLYEFTIAVRLNK